MSIVPLFVLVYFFLDFVVAQTHISFKVETGVIGQDLAHIILEYIVYEAVVHRNDASELALNIDCTNVC